MKTRLSRETVHLHLQHAIKQVDLMMEKFPDDFPSASTQNLLYDHKPNKEWTAGFFTGMVWLCFEITQDEKYRRFGQAHTLSFRKRFDDRVSIDFHDLGFLYSLSCVADYKLTGSEIAKETALLAAEHLAERFQEKGQFIQAWSNLDDQEEYRLIIDCFLNLPLLFWASVVTGDMHYAEIAQKHYHTAVQTVIRSDYTTYHTHFFNRVTGIPLKGATNQGYSDESCWSRGQAWAIYGIALYMRYCPMETAVEQTRFLNVLKVFTDFLGTDFVPVWDFLAKEDQNLKDSSAAAIVVCGLQTYLQFDQGIPREKLTNLKNAMLITLMNDYDTDNVIEADGLLLHGMHHWPRRQGVDESVLWGDYFYLEALVRESISWNPYW